MGGFCGSGETRRSSNPDKPLRRPRFNDFIRNVTDPQGLANEMGASEDRTIVVSADGTERPLSEDEQRFALKKDSPHFDGQDVGDEEYYTKPYVDKRAQAEKDEDDRADERRKAAAAAKEAEVEEDEEDEEEEDGEEETTTTPPKTPTAPVYTPPNYTNPVQTEAVQEVLADQDRGPKSGTIETSAQGISKDDTSGLRPKRKLKPKGLLNPETPARSQSLLASA